MRQYNFKFHEENDFEIIKMLDESKNKQRLIKALLWAEYTRRKGVTGNAIEKRVKRGRPAKGAN